MFRRLFFYAILRNSGIFPLKKILFSKVLERALETVNKQLPADSLKNKQFFMP